MILQFKNHKAVASKRTVTLDIPECDGESSVLLSSPVEYIEVRARSRTTAKLRNQPFKRGEQKTLRVLSYGTTGEGVAKEDGFPVFIDQTCAGDVVEVEIYDVRKSFALAKLLNVVEPSADRQEPVCPVFDRCGGCHWQHLSYTAQLGAKKELVNQALVHVGRLESVHVEDVTGAEEALRYRNKVQYPVRRGAKKSIAAGYFKKNSHELVDIDSCPVQPEPLDQVLKLVKEVLQRYRLSAYDETSRAGDIRHICVRQSMSAGTVLLTLVVNFKDSYAVSGELASVFDAIGVELMGAIPFLLGVCLNFNDDAGNKIMGDETVCVAGEPQIVETLRSSLSDVPPALKDGLSFELSPDSFFQVNTSQAGLMLDEVYTQINARTGGARQATLVDAYAGVGSIAQWISFLADRVIAIEVNESAVQDGLANLQLNGIDNIEFRLGTSENVLADMAREGLSCDGVVLDPPRKGCSPEVLEALLELSPKYVIYVSCNPSTLARDLRILQDGRMLNREGKNLHIGYKVKRVKPFDLFPQTYHVETVATLEMVVDDGPIGNLEKI
ncbi:MAG: 23S rRNA (uracil(1939)-C(5))-methyltransferase RlmD [Cyanobacteria bacterium]|nr:23S rRNA (uracil(1939)-C(5))-methyltransferase RlmD [Cyanobacteriota bacterium]